MGEADIINNIFSDAIRSLNGEDAPDDVPPSTASADAEETAQPDFEQTPQLPQDDTESGDMDETEIEAGTADDAAEEDEPAVSEQPDNLADSEAENPQPQESAVTQADDIDVNDDKTPDISVDQMIEDLETFTDIGQQADGAESLQNETEPPDEEGESRDAVSCAEELVDNNLTDKDEDWGETMNNSELMDENEPDSNEDDLDTLLSELASSAAACNDSEESADEDEDYSEDSFDDPTGDSLDELLEGALNIEDTPADEESGIDESDDSQADDDSVDEELEQMLNTEHGQMVEPAMDLDDDSDETDEALDDLFSRAAEDNQFSADDDLGLGNESSQSDGDGVDMFAEFGEEMAEIEEQGDMEDAEEEESGYSIDLDAFADSNNTDSSEDDFDDSDSTENVVATVKVPEPSIEVTEDIDDDEELQRRLAEIGLGDDVLLHNSFSSQKEKLLNHLMTRFEYISRKKLEKLPDDHIPMIKTVNLKVEIDLKFGEFSAMGDDDSLFNIDV